MEGAGKSQFILEEFAPVLYNKTLESVFPKAGQCTRLYDG